MCGHREETSVRAGKDTDFLSIWVGRGLSYVTHVYENYGFWACFTNELNLP